MSQIVRIAGTQMVEREFLIQALADLGLRWREGGRVGGRPVDIKLRWRRVGFRRGAGAFSAVYVDAAWRRIRRDVVQRYIYYATRAKLEEQGFTLVEEAEAEGRIHLKLRRMA